MGGDVGVVGEIGDVIMVGDDEGVEDIVGVWIGVAVGVGVIDMVVGVCTGVLVTVVVGGVVGVDVGVIFSISHVPLSMSVRIEPVVEYSNSPLYSPMLSVLIPSTPIT